MTTLHLLPGERQGAPARIAIAEAAIDDLIDLLVRARADGFAQARFRQRDNIPYILTAEIVPGGPRDTHWQDVPLAYLLNAKTTVRTDREGLPLDLSLLAAELFTARHARRHNQRAAAQAIGVSVGFISNIENCAKIPQPRNLGRLCEYIGSRPERYHL